MTAPLVSLAQLAKEQGVSPSVLHGELTISGVRTVRLGGQVFVWVGDDEDDAK